MIPLVPADDNVDNRLEMINQLKLFLVTAPDGWTDQDGLMKHHPLPTGETISCVKWDDGFFISGTDIVRCLVFRFLAFGRPVQNLKKFEEGVFSDLRNLKPGTDAVLEEPKSDFLELLFKSNCIRTQKKQKVFYWFSVPHDRLFLDALERDLKREKMGIEPTSTAISHPAVTISLDTTQALFDEFRKAMLSELNLDALLVNQDDHSKNSSSSNSSCSGSETSPVAAAVVPRADLQKASAIFGQFSLFEGSPSYKQRRRRNAANMSQSHQPYPSNDSSSSKAVSARNHHNNNRDAFWSSDSDPACTNNNISSDNMDTIRYFDCPLKSCSKNFKRLEHMKRHLRTHTMERPYLCDLCGKRFSRSDNLAQHKKTHKKHQLEQQKQRQLQKQQKLQDIDDDDQVEEEEDDDEEDMDFDLDAQVEEEEEDDDDDDSDYGMRNKNGGTGGRQRRHRSFSDASKQTSGRRYSKASSTVASTRSLYCRRNLVQRKRRSSHSLNGGSIKSMANNKNNNGYDPNWCNNNNNNNNHKTIATFRENYLKPSLSLSTTPSSSCHSSPSCLSENVPNSAVKIEQLDLFYDLASGPPLPPVTAETANNTTGSAAIASNGNGFITTSLDHSQTSLPSFHHHHHHHHDYTTADWGHHYSTSSSPRYDGLVLNYQFDDSPYMNVTQNNGYYDTSNQDLLYPMSHHSASTSPLPPLMVPFSSAAASPTDSCSDYLPTVVPSFYFSSPTMTPSDALVFK
jgi:hypothetical protein